MKTLAISPKGHLYITFKKDETQKTIDNKIISAFEINHYHGLLALAQANNESLSVQLIYWKDFVLKYLNSLCQYVPTGIFEKIEAPINELEKFALNIPPMIGAEYCSLDLLKNIWIDFDKWINNEIKKNNIGIQGFFKKYLPSFNQIGRICFHLAENKINVDYPFAFLATYASSFGKTRLQHQPLGKALNEYAGTKNKKALLHLLKPIYEASKCCIWVKNLIENQDIYHPLAWTAKEAYNLLKTAHLLEEKGIVLRLPNWWKKRAKPRVQVSIGNKKSKNFGLDAMLDFKISIAMEGCNLTAKELESIYSNDGLVFIKGQWVEVDKEKLKEALDHWESLKNQFHQDGISFIEGMRLLSGAKHDLSEAEDFDDEDKDWAYVKAGNWLKNILAELKKPSSINLTSIEKSLNAKLRPYQKIGTGWLKFLTDLGLGACLADDMGLGKTIQVIALLLMQKNDNPSILVLPASLISNWKAELQKFAPSLKFLCMHSLDLSKKDFEKISENPEKYLSDVDVVLTSYKMLFNQKWMNDQNWNIAILDEAQAIKNPNTKQTKAVKTLKSRAKIALTGTPVENRLGDLWSIFDFLSPGLLGSSSRFKDFIKALEKKEHSSFSPLRKLVQPYILRRLKTDKKVIKDLPDKTEVIVRCNLTKEQVKLYAKAVEELKMSIENIEGIKRKGLVLSFILNFKQICNHPSQLLGDELYDSMHSGKFIRLAEICEEISERQEKVLIFTQFRKIINPLTNFLEKIFGREGLALHGATPVKKRKKLVDAFQDENGPPFFILSLKAGGTGLNLTAASHVIHFDRWWNPAVENQATDRAFRIGQKKKVLVHKFVCTGTIEEKIDRIINEKKNLAQDILKENGEAILTELDDKALIDLVSLDITRV